MSIQRIDIEHKHTHGWQARVYVWTGKRLTSFVADKSNGGRRNALLAAKCIERRLKEIASTQP